MTNPIVTKATYSAEDNKLRIYVTDDGERFDEDTYLKVREAGFGWAPKQRLFVAPAWTPVREDLCYELAGDIVAEETTMLERAEMKQERLLHLADKRNADSNFFADLACSILSDIPAGQPILVGHHSEKRARKAIETSDRNMSKSVESLSRANYWLYRAEGVLHHANRKNRDLTRSNRIKKLLAELRSFQRDVNHGHFLVELWSKTRDIECEETRKTRTLNYAGMRFSTGPSAPMDMYSKLHNGEITTDEAIEKCIRFGNGLATSESKKRWIAHTLNRIGYERAMQGSVSEFTGKLTATILQAFARENGAEKPKCKASENGWTLSSDVPLPIHLGKGKELTLSHDEWVSLMVKVGYTVPAPKPKAPPIVNVKFNEVIIRRFGSDRHFKQIEMTKEQYSSIYSDHRGVMLTRCGKYRVKVCLNPEMRGIHGDWVAVFLTDSKVHDISISECESFVTVAEEVM